MARPGKRLPKYESPVPRAPSCVSAYELFTREVYAQIAAEFPLMSRGSDETGIRLLCFVTVALCM